MGKKKTELRKYLLSNSGQETHFPKGNECVAVCWNAHQITKKIKGKDKLIYTADVWEREPNTNPYIDFISVREGEPGEFYSDGDPAKGGQSAESATQLAEELLRAVEYLKKVK
jgi:hypothetical protein